MNLPGEALQGLTLGHQYLAAQQIQRLDTGGTFVDHADTGITYVLLHTPLGNIAVATEHLQAQVGRFIADFREERLGDRGQEAQRLVSRLAFIPGLAAVNDIRLLRSQVNEGAGTFGNRFLGQQHTTYVRVNDDRIGDTFRVLRAAQRAHGQAVLGVGQGALEAQFGRTQTLDGGTDTSRVHEGEHAVQPLVLRPDQPAPGAVEVHHASGVAVDPHLVLDGATGNRIALAGGAVVVRQVPGNDEQGNTLGAFRRARQTCQHDMNNVLGHVVLTG